MTIDLDGSDDTLAGGAPHLGGTAAWAIGTVLIAVLQAAVILGRVEAVIVP